MPAAADPDLALQLAKATADLYGQAVEDLLRIVARRLSRGIDTPGWAERKLLEQARLRDEARGVVDRLTTLGPKAIRTAITEGWDAGALSGGVELGIGFGRTHTRAVDALVREAVSNVTGTHGQILRSVDDAYRKVIHEASAGVLSGSQTRRQATQRALDRFADRGITGFRDRAGRAWTLDTYAEMSVRTASGRAQVAGTLDRYVAAGRELVIVSDAPQECPRCRDWEGQVLSISGGDKRYPSVADAQAGGLQHANCRHSLGAYIDGLTKPLTHTADPEGDQLRQEQRRLERGVRQWKRREAVAIDEPTARQAAARRRAWEGRLGKHVDDNGLKRLRYRESIGEGPPFPASARPPRKTAVPTRKTPVPPVPTPKVRAGAVDSASSRISTMPTTRAKVGREARRSLEAIEKVHRVPASMAKVPIESKAAAAHKRGLYRWVGDGPAHIRLNPTGEGQASTFAHEFGHYLDHQALGSRPGAFGSLGSDRHMVAFLKAADDSPTMRALAAEPSTSFTRYLQMRQEVFARAYAQYIARRSGDTRMLAELLARRGTTGPGSLSQWSEDEFEPIAAAIDAILESRGLLT